MGDHVFSETAALAQEVPEFKLTKQVKTTSGVSKFVDITNETLFAGKRVIIFGLPGAFTHLLVLVNNFQALKNFIMSLERQELMTYIALA